MVSCTLRSRIFLTLWSNIFAKSETEFENKIHCLSGAQMDSNLNHKNGGRKSRDTLPLSPLNSEPLEFLGYFNRFWNMNFSMLNKHNKKFAVKALWNIIFKDKLNLFFSVDSWDTQLFCCVCFTSIRPKITVWLSEEQSWTKF